MTEKSQDYEGNKQTNKNESPHFQQQTSTQWKSNFPHSKKDSRTSLLQSMARICSHKPKVPTTEL